MNNKEGRVKIKSITNNQSGMVAITVTMIMMIVISLIVIGFSTTTRREQRQALDYRLASQAYYAAESGINMARDKLVKHEVSAKSTCDDTLGWGYAVGSSAEITCLLIDPEVDYLEFTDVPTDSKVAIIDTAGQAFSKIRVSWENYQDNPTSSNCTGGSSFPVTNPWPCSEPLLRVDLVHIKTNTIDINQLKDDQFTTFLYPNTAGETEMNYDGPTGAKNLTAGFGRIKQATCSTAALPALNCNMDIIVGPILAGIPVGTTDKFAIRVMPLYQTADIRISALAPLTGSSRKLIGAQAVVDVTAKAQDVLKRVQARVKLSANSDPAIPDFAINADSGVCKRFTTFGAAGNGATFPGSPAECSYTP